jgi:hypothetical protein
LEYRRTSLKKWGMNTCGAWSSSDVTSSENGSVYGYFQQLRCGASQTTASSLFIWGGIPTIFTPAFETRTILAAQRIANG